MDSNNDPKKVIGAGMLEYMDPFLLMDLSTGDVTLKTCVIHPDAANVLSGKYLKIAQYLRHARLVDTEYKNIVRRGHKAHHVELVVEHGALKLVLRDESCMSCKHLGLNQDGIRTLSPKTGCSMPSVCMVHRTPIVDHLHQERPRAWEENTSDGKTRVQAMDTDALGQESRCRLSTKMPSNKYMDSRYGDNPVGVIDIRPIESTEENFPQHHTPTSPTVTVAECESVREALPAPILVKPEQTLDHQDPVIGFDRNKYVDVATANGAEQLRLVGEVCDIGQGNADIKGITMCIEKQDVVPEDAKSDSIPFGQDSKSFHLDSIPFRPDSISSHHEKSDEQAMKYGGAKACDMDGIGGGKNSGDWCQLRGVQLLAQDAHHSNISYPGIVQPEATGPSEFRTATAPKPVCLVSKVQVLTLIPTKELRLVGNGVQPGQSGTNGTMYPARSGDVQSVVNNGKHEPRIGDVQSLVSSGMHEPMICDVQSSVSSGMHEPMICDVQSLVSSGMHKPRICDVQSEARNKIYEPRSGDVQSLVSSGMHKPGICDVQSQAEVRNKIYEPRSGYVQSAIVSGMHEPRSGDGQSEVSSRMHKPRSGDVQSKVSSRIHGPRSGDVQSEVRKQMYQLRSGDVHFEVSSRMHEARDGDIQSQSKASNKMYEAMSGDVQSEVRSKMYEPRSGDVPSEVGNRIHESDSGDIMNPNVVQVAATQQFVSMPDPVSRPAHIVSKAKTQTSEPTEKRCSMNDEYGEAQSRIKAIKMAENRNDDSHCDTFRHVVKSTNCYMTARGNSISSDTYSGHCKIQLQSGNDTGPRNMESTSDRVSPNTVQSTEKRTDDVRLRKEVTDEKLNSCHSNDTEAKYYKLLPANGRFYCLLCRKSHESLYEIRAHVRTHPGVDSGTCMIDTRQSNDVEAKYYKRVSEKGRFYCLICNRSYQSRDLIRGHVRTHTGHKPYKCPHCDRAFTHLQLLKSHKKRQGDKVHECTLCDARLSFLCEYKKHLREVHKQGVFQCEHCGKSLPTSRHLAEHIVKHTGEKLYQCHICGEMSSSDRTLHAHLQYHTRQWQCELCKRCFVRKDMLERHMMVHSGDKPYMCHVCGKCFARETWLKQHMMVHTGDKPFLCHKCGLRCETMSLLRRHLLIHHK